MAKKVQYTTNQPAASTDYLAADNTWKTMSGGGGSPTGAAGGDLTGTYPNPTVHRIHGIDLQSGTPSTDEVWVYGGSPAKWQHQKLHASQTTNDSTVSGTNVDNALDTLKTSIATKQDTITGAATTITSSNLTSSRALVSNGGGKVDVSAVTTTELGRLVGVTSDIQTQLNAKQGTLSITTTGTSGPATLVGSTLNVPVYAGAGSGTSIQTILGSTTALAAATTRYNTVNGTTVETQVSIPVAAAMTINNLYVRTTATMPTNSSLQVTIFKNGVATSVTVNIAAGSVAGTYSDTTNNATYSAGDRYQIEFKNTGSATAAATSGQSFKVTI